jgi:hypothetical protein
VSTVFNTSATSANSQSSVLPSQPVILDLTTFMSIPTPSTVLASTSEKISKVLRAEFTKTSTQSSDSLAKNTITFQSQDSKEEMALFDSILRSEYLLFLFDGTRLKPVISADDPFGYTPNDIAMDPTTGIQTIIKADDMFHYGYDLKRSYQLLLLFSLNPSTISAKPTSLLGIPSTSTRQCIPTSWRSKHPTSRERPTL